MTLISPALGALSIRSLEQIASHTSLKVGGPADYFVEIADQPSLAAALAHAREHGLPVRLLGGGSNVLVAEAGIEGLVVKVQLRHFTLAANGDEALLTAGAGASLAAAARRVSKLGWAGLEWAVSVPGTFGGAVVNNAGAFGSCMAEVLVEVAALTIGGQPLRLSTRALAYGYRTSRLKRGEPRPIALVEARVRLRRDDPDKVLGRVAENQAQRNRTQPRQLSVGSVFANPVPDYAGRLIDAAGLKGLRIGGAQVSKQHANFIVNLGGATGQDVYGLVRMAQQRVWEMSHVWLCLEIELVGRWPSHMVALLQTPPEEANGPGVQS